MDHHPPTSTPRERASRHPQEGQVGSGSVVVVGASAGGLDALRRLVVQLPPDFAAPVLVVTHLPASASIEGMVRALDSGSLRCAAAEDGEAIERGRIYLAPPDRHLLLVDGAVRLSKGARENRSRPGIDPLFRSAAVSRRGDVIGVVLTGYLDDGSAGLTAIHRCGGACVVQEPDDAAYPDMPRNALRAVPDAHCVPLAAMGPLLLSLLDRKRGTDKPAPRDVVIEAGIAERVLSDLTAVEALGEQVPFNCPGCGGVLWEMKQGKQLRYRCHTGHSYTSDVLLAEQSAKMEETLWVALRMFEERRNLLRTISEREGSTVSNSERIQDSAVHIERIRRMLTDDDVGPHSSRRSRAAGAGPTSSAAVRQRRP